MTRTIGIVNAGTLTVYDMNGKGAVELARLRITTTDPSAILAIIEGLAPYLAAGAPAKAAGTRQAAADYGALLPRAIAYVTEHPGATTPEVKKAMGIPDKQTGSTFLDKLRRAGLHSIREADAAPTEPWRWCAESAVKRQGKS
jgi:hypothetical protein